MDITPPAQPPKKPQEPAKLKFTRSEEGMLVMADPYATTKRHKVERRVKSLRKSATVLLKRRPKKPLAIKLPNLSSLASKNHLKWKKLVVVGAIGLVLILGFVWVGVGKNKSPKGTTQTLGEQAQKPPFPVVLPNGNVSETDFKNVKYDNRRQTASYIDTVSGSKITVTQQPLPSRFQKDPATSIKEFAKEMYAKEEITAGDITAYAGVSIKGPETVVFIMDGKLFFITTDKRIANDSWSNYIKSLKSTN